MAATTRPRLLVKTQAGRELPVAQGFAFKKVPYRVELLFSEPPESGGFSLAGGEQWYLIEAAHDLDEEVDPWDFAHQAMAGRLGFAAADAPAMVEPDLLQEWPYENATPLKSAPSAFSAAEVCQFNDQATRGGKTPTGPDFGWFLRDDFSGLRVARETVGSGKADVRIAHLDTGYDENHVTLPARLSRALQRSFVEEDPDPLDARDRARRGLLKNPGHGTGTLGILAGGLLQEVPHAGSLKGKPLGGAPEAEVVPLRVANSVVLFRTSAIARAFEYLTVQGADVASMSMGGLASAAWTEAINAAYDAGVVIVCAAGNNFGGFPTRYIVYPARYHRVIAACGVMADGRPYNGLPIQIMQGNWGPRRKMETAIAAYTPNIAWAELGCSRIVDMDGQGTSSATPQVAAAAALWLMHHAPSYPERWMRVEAVRKALFEAARQTGEQERLGRGILSANAALAIPPAKRSTLTKTAKDRVRFPLIRILTGLGAVRGPRGEMFELEAVQLLQGSKVLEELLEENGADADDERMPPKVGQQLIEALAAEPGCSQRLRAYLEERFLTDERSRAVVPGDVGAPWQGPPPVSRPTTRALRTFAFDPSLGLELETVVLNEATLEVPWEDLQPGPVGDYVEVVDVDPATGCAYDPVDLNDPYLLARDGHDPSEGNPQFHQQMVFAVAMKTIRKFEEALGRAALWSDRVTRGEDASAQPRYREDFIRRLRIYPHALREANAYYSPARKALLFGYFPASRLDPGRNLPGGMVFTCLSHDIVAHETTHALLDGLHVRFAEPSNPDVLAFHEAFADLVALLQHFSLPAALRHQIARTRGDLTRQNLLGELAQQFGEAIGRRGALRSALGEVNRETHQWEPLAPDPNDYLTVTEPHTRGAILVAAVFDAFLTIYRHRGRDLVRLASGGTGVLPEGDIHPDLVNRLANEAAKTARHVLTICIRALDYCPPVDITFGDYLRALITADHDLVPNDELNYRVAFIEAFRRRGIYPRHVSSLSVESLRWRGPQRLDCLTGLKDLLKKLDLSWELGADRRQVYHQARSNRFFFWEWMKDTLLADENALRDLGLAATSNAPPTMNQKDGRVATELHSVRPARRLAPDGRFVTELVVEVTQRRIEPVNPDDPSEGTFRFRGGSTLLIDPRGPEVRYCIRKDVLDAKRLHKQRGFLGGPQEASLHATYFGLAGADRREPFALLHRGGWSATD